ncbi:leucine-rich repeat protein [Clostridium felsineum]|uniref:leucine-rich repeat protein n=1 Tax=Clostridium felsineum TaxID=36839 RepID=UPI00214D27BD|nr:leucine-rich repeat protein [Clostridium felsineum]MCR3757465.1 leucine-rich repeat protein [Clostridium felsineum]
MKFNQLMKKVMNNAKNMKTSTVSLVLIFTILFLNINFVKVSAITITGTDANGFSWQSDDGVTYSITGYNGNNTNITIPGSIDGHTVTSISSNAFNGNNDIKYKSLTSVTIPNTVTSIGSFAFYYCSSLVSISIPNSVTTIGDSAFAYCISLPNITLPTNLSSIGNSTFQDCKAFTGITIPSSVTSIGHHAFLECLNLTSVTIPNSVTTIGDSAFQDCKVLNNVVMPDSVISVGDYLFYDCWALTNVRLSSNITRISNFMFYRCWNLAGITLPNGITSIGQSAFEECEVLSSITIPSSVITIKGRAFLACKVLSNITIPNSVRTIEFNAFAHCYAFTNIIIPSSVTSIGDYAFYYCTSLAEVTIPQSVTSIGFLTFNSCDPNFKIKGFMGSYAQVYASSNSLSFEELSIPSYTVTFNSDGGSVIESVQANDNSLISAPAVPIKQGYTFGGWYKDEGFTNVWNFATDKVTTATTLYAKWTAIPPEEIYTVTFNSEGGSAIQSLQANDNSLISAPAVPTKTGYTFGGWYKDEGFTNVWNFATDKVTTATTLYVKWTAIPPEEIYTVTFNSDGGSVIESVQANDNSLIPTPAAPTKTGYTFGGWYKDQGFTNVWNFATDKVTTATILYAKWTEIPKVTYQSHIQSVGWQNWFSNGEISGTSGQSFRLEAMKIKLENVDGGIEYRTHVQNIGWMNWVKDGELSGTEGKSYRLEAIAISLTGAAANTYDIYYRVHAQNIGWMDWAKNGESAGTSGYGYRLEAIQITLVPKEGTAPGQVSTPFVDKNAPHPNVTYQSHVQNVGWQNWSSNGDVSGTSGRAFRLEAMKIKLENIDGGVEYRTHVQNIGWMNWVKDGELSGTEGKSYRLEAIDIRLTGAAADMYDMYYRVHAQNIGWMDWAKNGESAGTSGYGYRLEAIQIMLIPKGGAAPGPTTKCFVQK